MKKLLIILILALSFSAVQNVKSQNLLNEIAIGDSVGLDFFVTLASNNTGREYRFVINTAISYIKALAVGY